MLRSCCSCIGSGVERQSEALLPAQFGKAKNAAPDLSAVDDPLTDRTGLPNPFDKGSGGIPRASDITELAGRAKREVCQSYLYFVAFFCHFFGSKLFGPRV